MTASILTRELAQAAFDMVAPHIEATLKSHASQTDMAVAITTTEVISPHDPNKSFKENCLLVTGFGDPKDWKLDYEGIALSKAEKAMRTGINSVFLEAHYLREGDTPYWGSVALDGIVVGCSGVEGYYDEMFSMWIAAAIKALCKKRVDDRPKGQHFL